MFGLKIVLKDQRILNDPEEILGLYMRNALKAPLLYMHDTIYREDLTAVLQMYIVYDHDWPPLKHSNSLEKDLG